MANQRIHRYVKGKCVRCGVRRKPDHRYRWLYSPGLGVWCSERPLCLKKTGAK